MRTPNAELGKAQIFAEAIHKLVIGQESYDFFVGKMIWGLSLYLENGSFQLENFWNWHRKSDAAAALQKDLRRAAWKKLVRFEHSRPLKEIYYTAQRERDTLTLRRLLCVIGEYPPVVVTRREDQSIHEKLRSSGHPEERYAGIKLSFPLRSDRWETRSWLPATAN